MTARTCIDCGQPVSKYSRGRCRACANAQKAVRNGGVAPTATSVDAAAAAIGCRSLLRAHLRTGNHWITDPARFAAACAEAGA